jgi:hypothetical protein
MGTNEGRLTSEESSKIFITNMHAYDVMKQTKKETWGRGKEENERITFMAKTESRCMSSSCIVWSSELSTVFSKPSL